ncbi:hypothetical protein BD310DRAFT_768052, partial [Dichomitus squalens]
MLANDPRTQWVIEELDQVLHEIEVGPETEIEERPAEDIDISDWESGVEDLQDKSPDAVWDILGFPTKRFPGFNEVEDPTGALDPWDNKKWEAFIKKGQGVPFAPRWHQLVGVVKMMRQLIEGRPLLLMDQVGIGKTLQVVGTLCMYVAFRRHFARYGRFPGHFGKIPLAVAPDEPTADIGVDPELCLFGHSFGVVAMDEAGKLRNLNRQWTCFRELVKRGHAAIAMTATP